MSNYTDESCLDILKVAVKTGILPSDSVKKFINFPENIPEDKFIPIIECIQEIPCDPCGSACPTQAITLKDINSPPEIDYSKCTGCLKCIKICPGLAIFCVRKGMAAIPWEMPFIPSSGDEVNLLARDGNVIGTGTVKRIITGNTKVIILDVPFGLETEVRAISCIPDKSLTTEQPDSKLISKEQSDDELIKTNFDISSGSCSDEDIIVCRCMDITVAKIKKVIASGVSDIEYLKRITGFGTGICQGKGCIKNIMKIFSQETGIEVSLTTCRPPYLPLPVKNILSYGGGSDE